MKGDDMFVNLAVAGMRHAVEKDKPLRERIVSAMRYVRANTDSLFFMGGWDDENIQFKTALCAVLEGASEEERNIVTRSMKPLQMLAAATQGVPVDWGALEATDDILPLAGLWHDSKESPK